MIRSNAKAVRQPARPVMRWLRGLALSAALLSSGSWAAEMSVADFRQTLGINTHLNYTDGDYNQANKVIEALRYLGIFHIRDGAPFKGSQGQGALVRAAKAGLKFNFVFQGNRPPAATIDDLLTFNAANPGSIASLEAPNEVNNWPLSYGLLKDAPASNAYPATRAFVRDLRRLLRATPLRKTPLLAPSWVSVPTIDAADADAGNAHPYPRNGDQASRQMSIEVGKQKAAIPGKPVFITETGYNDATNIKAEAVDRDTAAKLILNLYAAYAAAGIERTFPYQLLDAYPDPGGKNWEKHWGLFDTSWQPKPAARAIHNLTTILSRGTEVRTTNRNVQTRVDSGSPDLKLLELARPDGATLILLWREADLWDQANRRPLAVAPASVRLSFTHGADLTVYSPVTSVDPVDRSSGASLTLPIGDSMMIVEAKPLDDAGRGRER
jgi:hypothetical protein